jgi:hypothetical protein
MHDLRRVLSWYPLPYTTNRVKVFDEAFLSRIHVALHFHNLSHESKIQVWKAFISKIRASASITPEQISTLAKRNINGREIKNAARTTQSLAVGKVEQVTFERLNQTLDVLEELHAEFRKKDWRMKLRSIMRMESFDFDFFCMCM